MHDIRWIRENRVAFDHALFRRRIKPEDRQKYSSDELIKLDDQRRLIIAELEQSQKQRNEISAEIGKAKRAGVSNAEAALRDNLILLRNRIQGLEQKQRDTEGELSKLLAEIPNIPFDPPDVPDGKDASDNVEHHHYGKRQEYEFLPKEHFDLGEALGQMDFETAAKLSGARFVVLKSGLARLERALGQFMLDVHTSDPHNYVEVNPPLMVRDRAMFGTAQLPKFMNDQFQVPMTAFEEVMDGVKAKAIGRLPIVQAEHEKVFGREMTTQEAIESFYSALKRDMNEYRELYEEQTGQASRLWLIPTAEVPLTNLVRESILEESQLPMRLTACTPCFRAEAGAAGKDTHGMIRQHQFTKVELVSITTPEQSKDEHERMLSCAEEILKRLDLHYRVVTLCAGDMGFASQKTYDIEVWLPGQNMFREISSCSVCGEFQARRMNARYRPWPSPQVMGAVPITPGPQPMPTKSTPRFLHTLNGSGVAVGRALIAVMETYQQADGSIAVPEALQGYMGGMKKIEKQ